MEQAPTRDPDYSKATLLKAVAREASRVEKATAERDLVILAATAGGCSLREIADAAGISHMTVKTIANFNARAASVDPLIPKKPIEQSIFKVTVRLWYGKGKPIAEAVELGRIAARKDNPDFEPAFHPALLDLP